jgi:hypothetical protein
MFSREITNDYGSYSKQSPTSILFKGVFDKNFRELKTIDPNTATYKVFNCPSQSINFAVKLGSSTYIPQHLFDTLLTAYKENNPYYTINDLVTIELDLSKTISYIESKYGAEIEANSITYVGTERIANVNNNQKSTATITTKSGSVDVTTKAILNTDTPTTQSIITVSAVPTQTLSSRLSLAGVTEIDFQFYVNNDPTFLNEENIIKHILFIFEETNTRVNGKYERLPDDFVPRSTDVVIPVTSRVTALDDYLRDVQRS